MPFLHTGLEIFPSFKCPVVSVFRACFQWAFGLRSSVIKWVCVHHWVVSMPLVLSVNIDTTDSSHYMFSRVAILSERCNSRHDCQPCASIKVEGSCGCTWRNIQKSGYSRSLGIIHPGLFREGDFQACLGRETFRDSVLLYKIISSYHHDNGLFFPHLVWLMSS